MLNLGVPNLYEGIGTSSVGISPESCVAVLGRPLLEPGRSITILKVPSFPSCKVLYWSSTVVEYECARLWAARGSVADFVFWKYSFRGLRREGVDGERVGVHKLVPACDLLPSSFFLATKASRPAELGGVIGKENCGCAYRWFAGRIVGLLEF